jgi:hydrogenase nickel incorporation protein HypA/HybF
MHEWALAEAVIAAASQIAEKEGLKEVTEVKIRVGELQQIKRDILEFALSQLKPAKFKKAKFSIEVAKAELKCRVCGHKWFFGREKLDESTAEAIHFVPEVAHTYIKCPKCGSPDFEILEGRGVWLESIKGVKNGDG